MCFREMNHTNFYVQVAPFFLYPLKILAHGSNSRGASSRLEGKRIAAKMNEKKFYFPKMYSENRISYLGSLFETLEHILTIILLFQRYRGAT